VLFLDVDNFKIINDSLGHQNGDHVLVAVGQRLRSCTRPEDIVARLGGDEFIILLEDITAVHDATQVAERITAALRAPIPLHGREVYITTSIGIVFNGCGVEQPNSLVRDADIALYRAKAAGKAQYVVFESSMNAQAVERLELETDLRGALERHDFQIYYQPIVCLETRRVVEVEALLRWPDPRRGLLTPGQFIPLAEETGLIVPLGEWVLRTACAQTKAWHDAGFPLRVAVNLSPRQVQHTDVPALLGTILADTGLPATFLTVELTESGVMDQLDVARRVLQAVHALGVQVALDDFGMGSSALTYLTRLPVTRVKLNHTFVQHVTTDVQQAALARGILALAQSLSLRVTVEGIETVDQMHFFRTAQADALQGYLVGRPMEAAAVPTYLAQAESAIAALLRGTGDIGAR
jgi:diguanylate cyclase (GGDEF)-like protein